MEISPQGVYGFDYLVGNGKNDSTYVGKESKIELIEVTLSLRIDIGISNVPLVSSLFSDFPSLPSS